MGMAVGGKKGVMADMNIVPLIDILLVLLIIFMAISPTTPHGLDAAVPQPAPPNQKQNQEILDKTIVVQVFADGTIKINQDLVGAVRNGPDDNQVWDALGARLTEIFKERAEKVAFVKGDDSVNFMEVAKAIDVMRGAGIDSVGLITAKIEAGQ